MREPRVGFGPFVFDPNSKILFREGTELPLPPRVTGVLDVLLRRAGDVVPRQELIDSVWKDAFVTDTSLAEAISALRQALGDDAAKPVYVQTLHRRGYRFVAPMVPVPVNLQAPSSNFQIDAFGEIPISNGQSSTSNVQSLTTKEQLPTHNMEAAVKPSIGMELVPWSIATICVVLAASAVWYAMYGRDGAEPPIARFTIAANEGTSFDTRAPALAISHDASTLAWSACDANACRLFVRPLAAMTATAIAGTEDAAAPFFSPDGRWIGFFADGHLKKVSLAGGSPITLADAPEPYGGAWADDGIVFAASPYGGLSRIAADGSGLESLTRPSHSAGEIRHAWPSLTPSGRLLAFTIVTAPGARSGGRIGLMRTGSSGPWRALLNGVRVTRAVSDDVLMFSRGEEVHVVQFDPQRLELSGATHVLPGASAYGGAQFATAGGALIMTAPVPRQNTDAKKLVETSVSPDGTRVAGVDADEGGNADVWVVDRGRGASTRITHGGTNGAVVWTPDSKAVFFTARGDGAFEIWRRDADAGTPAVRVFASDTNAIPLSVTPDGRALAFIRIGQQTRADIWLLPLAGGEARPLVTTPFDDVAAEFSPDGKLVAYQSNEGGRWEIYVAGKEGRRTIVSNAGGTDPSWTAGGRVTFRTGGKVMAVRIEDTDALRVSAPEPFPGENAAGTAPRQATVVLHWERELRALLGPPSTMLPR